MEIYYEPHKKRNREALFVSMLIEKFGITIIHTKRYSLPQKSEILDLSQVIQTLQNNIMSKKWLLLTSELKKLPSVIKVSLKTSEISCDVVVVKDEIPHFIEYHEKQHARLSDNRSRHIYDVDGNRISVPRFVQRFLRDIWRLKNLTPFFIVWDDKFQICGLHQFHLESLDGHEYSLDHKNYFSKFMI